MNLSDVSAEIRPRGHWAAIDFGFRLALRRFATCVGASAIVVVPVFALSVWALGDHGWLAPFVVWWTKPLWERATLIVVSRDLFGDAPGLRETLRAMRDEMPKQAWQSLTLRRLSPTRSLDLPVVQLEGLSGEARTRRLNLLRRGQAGPGAVWLLVVCAHLEGFIPLALLMVVQLFVPSHVDWDVFSFLFEEDAAQATVGALLANSLYIATVLLVAPFYVAGGFGLYINRRTELEGWDLEIAFRRMADRLIAQEAGHRRRSGATASGIAAVVLAALIGFTRPAVAEPEVESRDAVEAVDAEQAERDDAREQIVEILAGDAFHDRDVISVPRFVLDWSLDPDEDADSEMPAWIEGFFAWLAWFIAVLSETVLVAFGVVAIGYALYRYRDEIRRLLDAGSREGAFEPIPQTLAGLDVRPESLPEDVVAAGLVAWREGRAREAMALLYRASLSALVRDRRVALSAGATERDCLRAVAEAVEEACARYFAGLTRAWQLTAYAHRQPTDRDFERLCEEWPAHFTTATGRSTSGAGGARG